MNTRRLGLSALVLAVSCLGALAVASDRHLTSSQGSGVPAVDRPVAANPEAAPPSAEYLELQKSAIPQPSGVHSEESTPWVPVAVRPQR